MSSHQQFIDNISNRLKDWDYQLDRLEHRLLELGEEARSTTEARLADARQQRQQLREKLEQVRDSAEDNLQQLKGNLESRFEEMKSSINHLRDDLFGKQNQA